jgi:hypothetical protein
MTGTIRTNCAATACHPQYVDEAMSSMTDLDFEEFQAENERQLLAGELVVCAEPDEPGDYLLVTDRHGTELWVERRFIQWGFKS